MMAPDTSTTGSRVVILGTIVLLATLPLWVPNNYWLHVVNLLAIYWIIISGLSLVVGYTGILSIGHVGLFATGAYAATIVVARLGWSPFLALVVAGLSGALIASLLSLPSLRLNLFYFAMATIAFSSVVNRLTYGLSDLTGGGAGLPAPMYPGFFGTNVGFYYLVILVTLITTWLGWNLSRYLGRTLVAIRDSQEAAESLGVPVYRFKVTTFTFSGFLAGLAGALYASHQTYITPEAFTFGLSLFFFIAVLIGGRGSYWGSLVGAAVLGVLPELSGPMEKLSQLVYGIVLLIVVLFLPNGVNSLLEIIRDRRSPARERSDKVSSRLHCGQLDRAIILVFQDKISSDVREPVRELGDNGKHHKEPSVIQIAQRSLKAIDLRKSFGGVSAVSGVSLEVLPGTIHGLIGPNGSGKTTLLNLLSGYYKADGGSIVLDGSDVTNVPVPIRSLMGLSRTFQTTKILGELTVLDNVMLGFDDYSQAKFAQSMLGSIKLRRLEEETRYKALTVLAGFGLDYLAHRRANTLQHSEERFIEIIRAIAQKPRYLLLDEPAGGCDLNEVEALEEIVKEIRKAGVGILLVEHNSDFVFRVSDMVTVLDFGKVIASGLPQRVRVDQAVIDAYLGT